MNTEMNGHAVDMTSHEEQPQATPYHPEHLPALQGMADLATYLKQHADYIHDSGQRVVADFRKQLNSLEEEAQRMEIERQEAIHQVNLAHAMRISRNESMQRDVMAMIAFYTGQIPQAAEPAISHEPHTPAPLAPRRPRQRSSILNLLSVGRH